MTLPEDPAIPLLGICPKDSAACNKDIWPTMFLAALFVIEARKNLDVPQWRNGYRKSGIFTLSN